MRQGENIGEREVWWWCGERAKHAYFVRTTLERTSLRQFIDALKHERGDILSRDFLLTVAVWGMRGGGGEG
jgi:hypothetical protein